MALRVSAFFYFFTISFTDIFFYNIEYLRIYTVFNLIILFFFILNIKIVTRLNLTIFIFLFFFIVYNLFFYNIPFFTKHLSYVLVFFGVIILHLISIVFLVRKIGFSTAIRYLKYGYYLTAVCSILEFILNIFGIDVYLPGRENIATAKILFKRSYFYSTEPSTLASFLIILSPIIYYNLKCTVERRIHILISFTSVFSTLSIFSIITYPVMLLIENFRSSLFIIFFLGLLYFSIDSEIIDVFHSKLLFEEGGSGGERSSDFFNSLSLIKDNLLFGNGWGIETYRFGTSAHNFHLSIIVSNGLVGYLMFLLFFVYLNFVFPLNGSKFNLSCWISIFLSAIFLFNSSSFYEPHYYLGIVFLIAYGDRKIKTVMHIS